MNDEVYDQVLEQLLLVSGIGSKELATKMNLQEDIVCKAVDRIDSYERGFLNIVQGFGRNRYEIRVSEAFKVFFRDFLYQKGGFQGLRRRSDQKETQDEERSKKEIEHLQLQIDSLKRDKRRDKLNWRLTIISTLLAIGLSLYEVYKIWKGIP